MEDQYYDIERRTAIKEEARMFRRKFITYEQAEIIYSISHRKLRDIAEKAGAVYRINDVSVLINRPGWHIVRKDAVVRTTSLGDVRYERTLFKNVNTGASCYLLDQLMQFDKHTRITEDAEARILEEAVESSYRKGGINASIIGANITKETVMNKIHGFCLKHIYHKFLNKLHYMNHHFVCYLCF